MGPPAPPHGNAALACGRGHLGSRVVQQHLGHAPYTSHRPHAPLRPCWALPQPSLKTCSVCPTHSLLPLTGPAVLLASVCTAQGLASKGALPSSKSYREAQTKREDAHAFTPASWSRSEMEVSPHPPQSRKQQPQGSGPPDPSAMHVRGLGRRFLLDFCFVLFSDGKPGIDCRAMICLKTQRAYGYLSRSEPRDVSPS